jgi:coenzyme A diphosphatase NUDT7
MAYHSWYDVEWGPTNVRLHTFLTGREATGTKPITGLTASIMLEVVTIGFGHQPVGFKVDALGQANRRERIAYAINRVEKLQEAVREEKTRWNWEREERKEREKRSSWGQERAGLRGGGGSGGIIKSRL